MKAVFCYKKKDLRTTLPRYTLEVMAKETEIIKQKLELVEFLRSYLTLLPAGKSFKGLCPFHGEKTPSFIVSPERQMWHCFGCGAGGDIFKFVMLYDHLEFPEALKFLAERAGVQIQSLNPAQQREFGILYDLHEVAELFYAEALSKNREAQEYLKSRGLNLETVEEFKLGFAEGGEALTLHLIKRGYDIQDIVRAGLAQKNTRGLYRDKFHERIMFPIANQVGKTVAFTGRILPGVAERMQAQGMTMEPPKYLNSPETLIFNKSRILYGFDKSKQAIFETKTALLVEGQMDLLMAWQSGAKNVVAVSGTGLTPNHLERLRRFADTVIVSFDNDVAGLKALERALDYFHNFDFHVKVIRLGKYKDPADACLDDPGFLKKAIKWAKPAMEHILDVYFTPGVYKKHDIPAQKRVLRHLLQKVKPLRSAVEQNIWLQEISKRSGIRENALLEELSSLEMPRETQTGEEEMVFDPASRSKEGTQGELIARRLLALALTRNGFLDTLKTNSAFLPPVYREMLANPDSEAASFLELESSYEFGGLDDTKLEREFHDLLGRLETGALRERRILIQEQLKEAQSAHDDKKVAELLSEFSELMKKIDTLSK